MSDADSMDASQERFSPGATDLDDIGRRMISHDGSLQRLVWTDAHADSLQWHDCTIYAYLTDYFVVELSLDIDYICAWIHPRTVDQPFTHLLAPATLTFHSAHDIQINVLSAASPLQIADFRSEDAKPIANSPYTDSRWVIDGHHGGVTLRAVGYTLYFRRQPILVQGQRLSLDQRGGISFSRGPQ